MWKQKFPFLTKTNFRLIVFTDLDQSKDIKQLILSEVTITLIFGQGLNTLVRN